MASAGALRAAKHIRAVELSSGDWAHYDDNTRRWYLVDVDDLENLTDYLESDEQTANEAYSLWCANTESEEMPADWDPSTVEQRETRY